MAEKSNLKKIVEKIDVEKELLSTMPKNNEKNIKKYEEKIEELNKEYIMQKEEILKIFKKRYNTKTNIEENTEINNLTTRLQTIEKVLYLFNDDKDSYEKMQLDRNIYKIGKFYKENLENVNLQILECIEKFNKVGVNLTPEDFDYTCYTNEYMKVFFKQKQNLQSDALKNTFEDIYWKCPDIIFHIELNIRSIYFKYKVQIDKYFEKEKEEILKRWNKTPKEIMNSYLEIKRRRLDSINKDRKILIEEFLNNKIKISDYEERKIKGDLSKILEKETFENLKDNKEELKENIFKLLTSLYEYKNYINFKFIIDDIKKYYKEKESYKKSYQEIKSKIDKKQKDLKRINKKLSNKGILVNKTRNSNNIIEQNKLISELKELYKNLDLNRYYNKIANKLKDNSTIYEALNIAFSSYYYLTTLIINNDREMNKEEVEEKISELESFLKNPYNNIINNLTITDEKDVGIIIKDRYNLAKFIIEKEDLDRDNIDNLITTIENIEKAFNIEESKMTLEEIEELLQIKQIIK